MNIAEMEKKIKIDEEYLEDFGKRIEQMRDLMARGVEIPIHGKSPVYGELHEPYVQTGASAMYIGDGHFVTWNDPFIAAEGGETHTFTEEDIRRAEEIYSKAFKSLEKSRTKLEKAQKKAQKKDERAQRRAERKNGVREVNNEQAPEVPEKKDTPINIDSLSEVLRTQIKYEILSIDDTIEPEARTRGVDGEER